MPREQVGSLSEWPAGLTSSRSDLRSAGGERSQDSHVPSPQLQPVVYSLFWEEGEDRYETTVWATFKLCLFLLLFKNIPQVQPGRREHKAKGITSQLINYL